MRVPCANCIAWMCVVFVVQLVWKKELFRFISYWWENDVIGVKLCLNIVVLFC